MVMPYDSDDTKSDALAAMPPDYSESLTTHATTSVDIVPLKDLARWPRVVSCPACHNVAATRIVRKVGTDTQYVHGLRALFLL